LAQNQDDTVSDHEWSDILFADCCFSEQALQQIKSN